MSRSRRRDAVHVIDSENAAPATITPLSFVQMAARIPSTLTSSASCRRHVFTRDAAHYASLERRRNRCTATVVRPCYLLSLPCRHSCMSCALVVVRCHLLNRPPIRGSVPSTGRPLPLQPIPRARAIVQQRHGARVTNISQEEMSGRGPPTIRVHGQCIAACLRALQPICS